jgi:hypothetical protein
LGTVLQIEMALRHCLIENLEFFIPFNFSQLARTLVGIVAHGNVFVHAMWLWPIANVQGPILL